MGAMEGTERLSEDGTLSTCSGPSDGLGSAGSEVGGPTPHGMPLRC